MCIPPLSLFLLKKDGSGCSFGKQSTPHFGSVVKGVNLVVGLTYHVTVIATFNHMNSQKKSRTSNTCCCISIVLQYTANIGTEQYLMFLRCLGIGLLKSTTMKQRPSAHGRVQIIVSQLKQSITVCEVQRYEMTTDGCCFPARDTLSCISNTN